MTKIFSAQETQVNDTRLEADSGEELRQMLLLLVDEYSQEYGDDAQGFIDQISSWDGQSLIQIEVPSIRGRDAECWYIGPTPFVDSRVGELLLDSELIDLARIHR